MKNTYHLSTYNSRIILKSIRICYLHNCESDIWSSPTGKANYTSEKSKRWEQGRQMIPASKRWWVVIRRNQIYLLQFKSFLESALVGSFDFLSGTVSVSQRWSHPAALSRQSYQSGLLSTYVEAIAKKEPCLDLKSTIQRLIVPLCS